MTPTYERSVLLNAIVDTVKYKNITQQVNTQNLLNRVVRIVLSEVDIRSTKRKAAAIQLFDDEYDYTAPSDIKDEAIIDIQPQKPRKVSQKYTKVSPEEFDRKKSLGGNLVTIEESEFGRKLRFTGDVDDTSVTFSGLDALDASGGTWGAFGDASGVAVDTNQFIEGSGSLSFDLVGAGTTAGIVNSTLTSTDISKYTVDGALFAWAYIVATANLTNFILRIGSDASNYHAITVTTQADGQAFVAGWNLLRFNFVSTSDTGTPVDTATDYCALYMTKSSGKTGNDYRFDGLVLHTGQYAQVYYYSKFGWENSSGTRLENSTAANDYILATTDEMPLFEACGRREFFKELSEYDAYKIAAGEYELQKQRYKLRNPTERMKQVVKYWS